MKRAFYNYSDDGRKIVTVCVIEDNGVTARGVAVCSPDDEPDMEKGMRLAERYALHAIKGRDEIRITDRRAIGALIKVDCPWLYHSELKPDLSWRERKCLFGRARMYECRRTRHFNNAFENKESLLSWEETAERAKWKLLQKAFPERFSSNPCLP